MDGFHSTIFSGDRLLAEPGLKYSYSTYGFNLLGAAVESASGEKFVEYLRRHVFLPAGMEHAGPDDCLRNHSGTARVATGSRPGIN